LFELLKKLRSGHRSGASRFFDVIRAFDEDVDSNKDSDEDSDEDEGAAMEVDHQLEEAPAEDSDEEIVVPRKRARMAVAPSRVPVLVSITNSPSRRQRR
jgi:hypothetical protein